MVLATTMDMILIYSNDILLYQYVLQITTGVTNGNFEKI